MKTSTANLGLPSTNVRSLTLQAFEQLRADILLGELLPDERLRIQNLSDRYSIGTTAIREALSRLLTDGLVESEDQKGFYVSPVSKDELIDLTKTRIQIEQLAISQAIETGDIEWESRVLSSYHRLSRVDLPTSPEKHNVWAPAHRQFHESLVSGCKSQWLIRLCTLLYDKSERYRNLAERYRNRGILIPDAIKRDTNDEHLQLMDAVMAKDTKKALQLTHDHFWQTTNIILKAGLNQGVWDFSEISEQRQSS